MTEHDELSLTEMTPTLAETARRRTDLHVALVGVEQAISRAASGREQDWSKDVIRALQDLQHAIEEHIEVTERSEGLYDEIRHKAPRFAATIDRLRNEHPELREVTRDLIGRLESTPVGDAWPLAEARDDLQRLLGRIVRHRQLGADLVWEAYNLDIGGVE
jgi:hemerythrin-like domain-containing protein